MTRRDTMFHSMSSHLRNLGQSNSLGSSCQITHDCCWVLTSWVFLVQANYHNYNDLERRDFLTATVNIPNFDLKLEVPIVVQDFKKAFKENNTSFLHLTPCYRSTPFSFCFQHICMLQNIDHLNRHTGLRFGRFIHLLRASFEAGVPKSALHSSPFLPMFLFMVIIPIILPFRPFSIYY